MKDILKSLISTSTSSSKKREIGAALLAEADREDARRDDAHAKVASAAANLESAARVLKALL